MSDTAKVDIVTKIKSALKDNTSILDPFADRIPPFRDLAKKQNMNSGAFLAIALGILSIVILLLQGWTILFTCITVLWPSLNSIRVIDSQNNLRGSSDEKAKKKCDDKIKHWMTYWIVYGIFTALETFVGFVFYFIPYWGWIRIVFFLWLLTDKVHGMMGCAYLYQNVLEKQLKTHKVWIQSQIDSISASASQGMKEASKAVAEKARDPSVLAAAMDATVKVQQASNDFAKDLSKEMDDV